MGRLSNISGKKAVKIFQQFGYVVGHQTGSHIILWHETKPILSVPNHMEMVRYNHRRINRHIREMDG